MDPKISMLHLDYIKPVNAIFFSFEAALVVAHPALIAHPSSAKKNLGKICQPRKRTTTTILPGRQQQQQSPPNSAPRLRASQECSKIKPRLYAQRSSCPSLSLSLSSCSFFQRSFLSRSLSLSTYCWTSRRRVVKNGSLARQEARRRLTI